MMSYIWCGMVVTAVIFGILNGKLNLVSLACTDGAKQAVEFIISITGMMAFWSGIMEIMSVSGIADKISRIVRPVLKPLFGKTAENDEAAQLISSNITANLLGISNAATPIGIKAAAKIHALSGNPQEASNALITLVVLNTASLQLFPTTVAALRASLGSEKPYAILIPVWISSAISVSVGLLMTRILSKGGNSN